MERLSIGLLARNEAGRIAATLRRLGEQSVFDPVVRDAIGLASIEVIVVPNACTDATERAARTALSGFPDGTRTAVLPLDQPGKSNAWNRYVHDFSSPDATLIALMDADIDFASDDVLEQLVGRLATDGNAQVASDVPLKDYRGRRRLGPLDLLSRSASAQRGGGGGLCGQLYCGRAAAIRRIWLPSALPVEDGFIAAMIKTDGFTHPPRDGAIASVPTARHYFEPHSGIAGFVRHEARIIVGSVINAWLYTILWAEGRNGHVGRYIAARNADDPNWVEKVCATERGRRGRVLIPHTFLTWRLGPLRRQPLRRKVMRLPVALAATVASLPAAIRANAILRAATASRHW